MTNIIGKLRGPAGELTSGAVNNSAPQVFSGSATFQQGIITSPTPGVTTPAVPATTVAQSNGTGVDVMVYLTSGGAAVTVIKVNGVTTGLNLATATSSSASVYLPAGATITLTYASTAPTWVWLAV